jgi:hypothetical protein
MSVCYRKRKIDLTLPQCLVRLGRTGLARPVRSLGREQKTCTQLHGEPVAAFGATGRTDGSWNHRGMIGELAFAWMHGFDMTGMFSILSGVGVEP